MHGTICTSRAKCQFSHGGQVLELHTFKALREALKLAGHWPGDLYLSLGLVEGLVRSQRWGVKYSPLFNPLHELICWIFFKT